MKAFSGIQLDRNPRIIRGIEVSDANPDSCAGIRGVIDAKRLLVNRFSGLWAFKAGLKLIPETFKFSRVCENSIVPPQPLLRYPIGRRQLCAQ